MKNDGFEWLKKFEGGEKFTINKGCQMSKSVQLYFKSKTDNTSDLTNSLICIV